MSGCGKETKESKEKDDKTKECERGFFQAESECPEIFTRNPFIDASLPSKKEYSETNIPPIPQTSS